MLLIPNALKDYSPMLQINPDKIADIIKDVAYDKIVPRFQTLQRHEISTKSGPTDLVTIADIEAEIELTKILKDILPGSYVVGEEAVSKNETDMGLLATQQDYIWVIDPVDGTSNFAAGKPIFGTILALVKNGEVIQSWIYDIPNDRMAIGEKGSGVQINSVSMAYKASPDPLREMRGFISQKYLTKKFKGDIGKTLKQNFGEITPYMCCAHEYLDILSGKSFYAFYSRIRPWDHLAGAMMLGEAGGFIRKWDKSLYVAGDDKGGLICTPNEDLWHQIYDLLIVPHLIDRPNFNQNHLCDDL